MIKRHYLDRKGALDYIGVVILVAVSIVTIFPFWNVIVISLNDPTDALRGGLFFWPRRFTLGNLEYFFMKRDFLRALLISVSRTVIGAASCVLFTAAFSYGLSKEHLVGRSFIIKMLLITLYVNGGLIPTFLLIKGIGLYKNFLVYIVPELLSNFYAIIMITYFKSLPAELEESVKIDGGNDLVIFLRVVLPISSPIIASVALFVAVYQWNAWFDTILYGSPEIVTLQAKLVEIIRNAAAARKAMESGLGNRLSSLAVQPTVESLKTTAMMITAVPIIAVYPFLQRYFVKGIMIGSLKG